MTVKARIALGIAVLLSVIALLGGVAVWYLDRIEASVSEVAGTAYDRLDLAQSLGYEAASLHGRSSTSPLGGRESLPERRARFAERLRIEAIRLFEQPVSNVDELVIDDLETNAQRLLDLTGTDGEVAQTDTDEALSEIMRLLQGVYGHNASVLEAEIELASAQSSNGLRFIGLLVGLCVAFSLAVLIWLPRYVAQPIRDFSESIARITAGNYATRLQVDRRDEFGRLASNFNRMAEQLEAGSAEGEAAVLESQARLSALVNQLDELLLGMDAGRMIVFVNEAMADYLGVDAEEVLGQYMPDLALGRPRVQQLFRPIALRQDSGIEPFAIQEPDGTLRYLQERVIRLRDPETGEPGDYIVSLSDVTDYEQRTHEQTDYLAAVSHEMKTPLAAITMSVDLLEDPRLGGLDEDQRELTQTVRQNAQRLLRMVREVLSLSESEAGALRLDLTQFDVGTLLERVTRQIEPLATDKGIGLSYQRPAEAYRIEGDEERVATAVTNLLSNAIRYSPAGGTITLAQEVVSGGVRLSVTDEGPGVRPEDRERIFGRYKRGTADDTTGTGLGLAISREGVEAHGGRLYVDAAYGPGARFVLELPRRLSEAKRRQQLAVG